jgi:AraC family L-rhamnose operon regulatory protein RhaS
MADAVITFQDRQTTVYADTCEPLKSAARRGELALYAWSRGSYPGLRLPAGALPEVRSVGVWDANRPQRWGLEEHCNEGIEFTYLARGKTAFAVEDRAYPLRAGHLTITRPWQRHRVGRPYVGASRLVWFILDVGVRRPNQAWQWPPWLVCSAADLRRLTRLLRDNEQPVWRADDQSARRFEDLAALLQNERPRGSETKLTLILNEILVAILELLQAKRIPLDSHLSSSRRAVEIFLAGLPRHAGTDWTLPAMAEACGLSRSQFSAYCRQITNMTPIEYLTHCRVEQAARMLRQSPGPDITEIALACGFSSSQYFATVFRNHTGCSPSQYRATQAWGG